MQISDMAIAAVKLLQPKQFADPRGFFSETYNHHTLAKAGIDIPFVQDNHSLSRQQGVVRGLHFQIPPAAQAKLVRVVQGSIFDVAVDLRRNSPTFGQHVSAILSAANWCQLLIPVGFAHGLMTLEPDTEVVYKVSDFYHPELEQGVIWNDVDLGIKWPDEQVVLSERDRQLPRWQEIADKLPF